MKPLLTVLLLAGFFSGGADAGEKLDRVGEIITKRVEITGLTKSDFTCDVDFFECRYKIAGIKNDKNLRSVAEPSDKFIFRYNGSGNRFAWVKKATFTNSSSQACEVTARIVPVGGTDEVELVTESCCRPAPTSACFNSDEATFDLALPQLGGALLVDVDLVKEN